MAYENLRRKIEDCAPHYRKQFAAFSTLTLIGAAISFAPLRTEATQIPVGVVVAWGDNYFGQASVPGELNDIVAVATGFSHSLALRRDGKLFTWGTQNFQPSTVPSSLTNVIAIAAGYDHSVAIKADGTAIGWGRLTIPWGVPVVITTNAVAVAAGDSHAEVLRRDGTVIHWGAYYGTNIAPIARNPIARDVVAIAAGTYHSLVVKSDGAVVGWGRNDFGQCNPPPGLSNVVAVAAGNYHSTALRRDGTVVCWGTNWVYGEFVGQATPPAGLTGVVAIAAGGAHNLALKDDGTLVAWGWNGYGQTNVPAGLSAVVAIASSTLNNLVVTAGPVIRQQPGSATVRRGETVTFSASAEGNPPLGYQWRFNGVPIDGATGGDYTRTNVQLADIGMYSVIVSNFAGSVTSSDAGLTVIAPPQITMQPQSRIVTAGQDAYFSVEAVGTLPLRYQWRFNGSDIVDATTASLTLPGVRPEDGGNYSVLVMNDFGSEPSSDAVLKVNRSPVADASATLTVVIAPNGKDAKVLLDGSRSLDPDGDQLSYLWFERPSSEALSTGVVAVVVLPVGTHAVSLVVNDGWAASSNSVSVTVITASSALARLVETVAQSTAKPKPLLATLNAALAAINRGSSTPAIHLLQAFQNQVRAQVATNDPVLAAKLILDAQQIIDALDGSTLFPHGVIIKHVKPRNAGNKSLTEIGLQFDGYANRHYIIEASTNLRDWKAVGVANNGGEGAFTFEDVEAHKLDKRFYRIVLP